MNSTPDALGYASAPEIGPHHLLYDLLCKALLEATQNTAKTLLLLKLINALFAGGILWIAEQILRKSAVNQVWVWLLFIGSSFGLMRFAVENETYILPIFFSIAGTRMLLYCEQDRNYAKLIPAFFLFGIAILFHQIHLMWFMAASIALIRKHGVHIRILLFPFTTVFGILSIYFLQSVFLHESLIDFLTGVIDSDTVQLKPGIDNFTFTGINFIRSFMQFHGVIAVLFKNFPLVSAALYLALGCILSSVLFLILSWKNITKKPDLKDISLTRNTLLFAFIFQLIFAWYSVGNAEFMAMLPLLLALFIATGWNINLRIILFAGTGMLIWNSATALLPDHYLNYRNLQAALAKLEESGGYFIAYDKVQLENHYNFSHFGDSNYSNVVFMNVSKSPAEYPAKTQHTMRTRLQKMLDDSIYVRTDCIGYPSPVNRKSMLQRKANEEFFAVFKTVKIDSYDCFYGRVFIHQILKK